MSRYVDTTGHTSAGIGLCDRCQRKFPLDELRPDGDSPGLLVCREDRDQLDPYKLPARKQENISLRVIRPDVDIDVEADSYPSETAYE